MRSLKLGVFVYFMVLNTVLYAQNVGIGTTTPTRAKLEVQGAVDATTAIFGGESSGISIQRNWPAIGFNTYWSAGNRNLTNGYGAKQYFDPNNGYMYLDMLGFTNAGNIAANAYRAFSISQIGNVGIGGGSPNGQLQLSNTLANRKIVLWESANNNHQYFGFGIESGTMRYAIAGADNVHRFYAGAGANASAVLMSIWGNKSVIVGETNGNGRLGINSGFPAYTLDIFQAPGGGGIRLLSPDFHNTNWELKNEIYSNEAWTSCLALRFNAGGLKGWFRPTDGGYTANSDSRLKKNIQSMEPVLERLLQLRPSRYEMKEDNPQHEQSLGFLAQETKELFPEVVDVLPSKPDSLHPLQVVNQQGINYSALSVIAIKAIQEQQQQISVLQMEMKALKEQNTQLILLLTKK